MQIDLTNQNILVTGASRGIGAAITDSLLTSGAHVIGTYSSSRESSLKNHPKLYWEKCDFNDLDSVVSLVTKLIKEYRISALVNNAGIAIDSNPTLPTETWINDWEKTLRINLTASTLLCKELIPHFQANSGGRIVNIVSRAAFRGDTEDFLAYAASKGGLLSMSRSLARAYGKDKIMVFNIAPGFIRTEMASDFEEKYGSDYIKKGQALEDLTEADHVAPTVVFLLSGMADHATGTTIDINAGSYIR